MQKYLVAGVLLALAAAAPVGPARATSVTPIPAAKVVTSDCVAVYGAKVQCVGVPCDAKYHEFLGTWRGQFHAYLRKQSRPGHAVFRPYRQAVTYRKDDCLRNTGNGDVFIVGHVVNHYPAFGKLPAKVETNLLVTGRHANGTPFLRTVRKGGTYDYSRAFQDAAAGLSIWRLELPAAHGQPPMVFTIIDGRDVSDSTENRRDVTITMRVGPAATPYWQGVIAYGSHARHD